MVEKTCPKCGLAKPIDDFAFKYKAKGVRQWCCRPCNAAYKLSWYARNREMHKRKVRLVRIAASANNQARCWSYLAQHPCVDCGETDPIVLEFDHLRDKFKNVSYMVGAGFAWSTIEREIGKCEVRCANCHRRRTARVQGIYDTKHNPKLIEGEVVYSALPDNWPRAVSSAG